LTITICATHLVLCCRQQHWLEVLLEERESGASNAIWKVGMLSTLVVQFCSNRRRTTKEYTDVFPSVLHACLFEYASPVRPAKKLLVHTCEILDLRSFDFPSQKHIDVNNFARRSLHCRSQQVIEPIQLVLTSDNPIKVDTLGH